jgi:hypothetical protein
MRRENDRPLNPILLLRIEEPADLCNASVTSPYFQERARHSPHHSAQKSRADDVQPHLVSKLAHLEGEEFSARVIDTWVEFLGKRPEIVITRQYVGSLLHRGDVQGTSVAVGKPGPLGIRRSGKDAVTVEPILCPESAVELGFHARRTYHGQIGVKPSVQDGGPLLGRHRRIRIEMANLAPGVSAAIGAARSGDLVFLA